MNEQENRYEHKIITIPNILSLFRLCLIPLIIWLYCVKEDSALAILVLLLSGFSDIVDGYIARKYNMVSNFGKVFDPVADKATQLAMLICLIIRFPVMIVLAVLLAVKEILASVMGLVTIKKAGLVTGAEWHGKLTTVCIYTTILLHLAWYDTPPVLSYILVGVCVCIMLYSSFMYTKRSVDLIKKQKGICNEP